MKTQQKIVKGFHDQPLYSSSLAKASPTEAKVIIDATNVMFGELFEMVNGIKKAIDDSPDLREQLQRVLRGEEQLVNDEFENTGSMKR